MLLPTLPVYHWRKPPSVTVIRASHNVHKQSNYRGDDREFGVLSRGSFVTSSETSPSGRSRYNIEYSTGLLLEFHADRIVWK